MRMASCVIRIQHLDRGVVSHLRLYHTLYQWIPVGSVYFSDRSCTWLRPQTRIIVQCTPVRPEDITINDTWQTARVMNETLSLSDRCHCVADSWPRPSLWWSWIYVTGQIYQLRCTSCQLRSSDQYLGHKPLAKTGLLRLSNSEANNGLILPYYIYIYIYIYLLITI